MQTGIGRYSFDNPSANFFAVDFIVLVLALDYDLEFLRVDHMDLSRIGLIAQNPIKKPCHGPRLKCVL